MTDVLTKMDQNINTLIEMDQLINDVLIRIAHSGNNIPTIVDQKYVWVMISQEWTQNMNDVFTRMDQTTIGGHARIDQTMNDVHTPMDQTNEWCAH